MTQEQKDHATSLLRMGEKLEVVRYFQQSLKLDPEQAIRLTEKLEEEEATSGDHELREKLYELRAEINKPSTAKIPRTVGLIFMSIGIIMLTIVVYLIYSDFQFSKLAVSVTGNVVDYDSHYSSDSDGGGSTMYTPIFEYTSSGTKHTYVSSTSSSSQDFAIGEPVEIWVDPNDPATILVNTFWERYLMAVVLGFMGVMFAGLGYMAYRFFG